MGMTIAAEKLPKPEHVAIVVSADDHWPAGPFLNEPDAAQNEGAHNSLAKSASAISNARSWFGGMTRASTASSAYASTKEGLPES